MSEEMLGVSDVLAELKKKKQHSFCLLGFSLLEGLRPHVALNLLGKLRMNSFLILPIPPPKCWDYKPVPPHPVLLDLGDYVTQASLKCWNHMCPTTPHLVYFSSI